MSAAGQPNPGAEPSEEELRAAYEAEIKKIRVEHVLLEHVVTMVNLGMRRTGLSPGTETERDPGQVQLAIESIRRLIPLVEQAAPAQARPIRDALSQLQLAFVRVGGQPGPDDVGEASGGPGTAQPPSPQADPGRPQAARPDPAPPRTAQPGQADPGQTDPGQPGPAQPDPGQPGPAQRSGRLWVPGQ